MSGEFPTVPNEAKSFNDMVAWAAEHGQAESVRDLLDAAASKNWDGALDAVHKLEDMSELADKAGAIGKHFDTIDKVGKALEIAQAVEKGDYAYASAKLGAEVLDTAASGYLDSLGPGGIMLNYAVHETGEVMSSYLTEAQQFGPDSGLAEASGNEAAVAAYTTNRDYMEGQIREQSEAGRPPEEIQQWTKDHMEAHGAIYNNLKGMEAQGDGFVNRFEKDIDWAAERIEVIAKEGETQPPANSDGPSFFTPFMDAAKESLTEFKETATEIKDFVVEKIDEIEPQQAMESVAREEAVQPDAQDSGPGAFAQMSALLGKINETIEGPSKDATAAATETGGGLKSIEDLSALFATLPESTKADIRDALQEIQSDPAELEISVAPANSQAKIVEATIANPAPAEVAINIDIPLPPAQEPFEVSPAQPQLSQGLANNTPPEATEILLDREMTETEKLDAYVSQIARDAEAQENEQALAGQAPPPATEIVVVDATADVIEIDQSRPDQEHEEVSLYQSRDVDHYS